MKYCQIMNYAAIRILRHFGRQGRARAARKKSLPPSERHDGARGPRWTDTFSPETKRQKYAQSVEDCSSKVN